jgi:RNA polymerase sigma-70 factor (ECF subfamily)
VHDPDAPLVKRAQRGDQWAFEQLVERHQHRLFTLAARTLGSPHDAADAVQEAFLRAWLALPRFRRGSLFSTWLYRICLNAAHDQRLKRRAEPIELVERADPRDTFAESSPGSYSGRSTHSTRRTEWPSSSMTSSAARTPRSQR